MYAAMSYIQAIRDTGCHTRSHAQIHRKQIPLDIDGRDIAAASGQPIPAVVREQGILIPALRRRAAEAVKAAQNLQGGRPGDLIDVQRTHSDNAQN